MNEEDVGRNIRRIREREGLKLGAAAVRASMTASALSKIEKAQSSAPLSTLMSIADALGVSLANFFEEPVVTPNFVVTRKGRGKIVVRDGSKFGYAYEALAVEMPDKRVDPFILSTKHGDKAGYFQHGGQEFNYVLSGHIEMRVGDETVELLAGDAIYFNPRLPHGSRMLSKEPVRILCLFIQDNPKETKSAPQPQNKKKKSK